MANNELRITMLGPRGVGKTTLLASMYSEFDNMVKNINLTLTPSQATSSTLQQRLAELKSQTEVFLLPVVSMERIRQRVLILN